jgi:hypothetical protein
MAKKKKFPKAPKRSASLAVWQRYEQRCKDVAKYNKEIEAKPSKISAIADRIRKMR